VGATELVKAQLSAVAVVAKAAQVPVQDLVWAWAETPAVFVIVWRLAKAQLRVCL
jgi:hypothetical protein